MLMIYEASFLLTLIQSRYPGGMPGFAAKGGAIVIMPVAKMIVIFGANLHQDAVDMIISETKKRNIGVAFVESWIPTNKKDDETQEIRSSVASYIMKKRIFAARLTMNSQLINVQLLENSSGDLQTLELCSYITSCKRRCAILVECKDCTLVLSNNRNGSKGISCVERWDVINEKAPRPAIPRGTTLAALPELEISLVMDLLINAGLNMVRERGTHSPIIYALSKNRKVNINVDDEIIVERENALEFRGMYEGQVGIVYVSILATCIQNLEQGNRLNSLAREVALQPDVDAVGLIEAAYYKEGVSKSSTTVIQNDPDSQTILHACYYVRGDPTPRLMNIPFIMRGKLKDLPENDIRWDVQFAYSTWVADWGNTKAHRIDFPFSNM